MSKPEREINEKEKNRWRQLSFNLSEDESQILSIIRNQAPIDRANIIRQLKFSRAKTNGIINDLVDNNFIKIYGHGASSGGKRPQLLEINAEIGYVIGVDIGVTSMDVAIANFKGEILDVHGIESDIKDGPIAILQSMMDIIEDLKARNNMDSNQFVSIAIGVPGPVDVNTGEVKSPPLMPGWNDFPITEFIKSKLPNIKIIIDNDFNMMARGEYYSGIGKGHDLFVFVKIGTGIGAGIIINGDVFRGHEGSAGQIGHISVDWNGPRCICGVNQGCVSGMAAGPAITAKALKAVKENESEFLVKRYKENNNALSAKDVGDALADGDQTAIEIINESGTLIGLALSSLVNLLNPGLIVLGGGITKSGNLLLSSIRQTVLTRALPFSTRHLRIEYSSLGDKAGVTGAVILAIKNVECSYKDKMTV
ncbi:MAG: ROK family protein [Anaerolineaceae bacterium]|nr:ROK family protein [Anaerolineaceae bacterium]